jgi:hypothetical protein
MARILVLLSLMTGLGFVPRGYGARPAAGSATLVRGKGPRSPIGPGVASDCAQVRDVELPVLPAVTVDDRDEDDNEDDFREVGQAPGSLEPDRERSSRAVCDPSALVSRLTAPEWRIPLLC